MLPGFNFRGLFQIGPAARRRRPDRLQGGACLASTVEPRLLHTLRLPVDGHLAKAEPKRLRYQLLHVPARIHPHARQRPGLRIPASWPWATDLGAAPFAQDHSLSG
jgi:hypothetical protein